MLAIMKCESNGNANTSVGRISGFNTRYDTWTGSTGPVDGWNGLSWLRVIASSGTSPWAASRVVGAAATRTPIALRADQPKAFIYISGII